MDETVERHNREMPNELFMQKRNSFIDTIASCLQTSYGTEMMVCFGISTTLTELGEILPHSSIYIDVGNDTQAS